MGGSQNKASITRIATVTTEVESTTNINSGNIGRF